MTITVVPSDEQGPLAGRRSRTGAARLPLSFSVIALT